MTPFKILITDGLDETGQFILRAVAQVDDRSNISADDLLKAIPDYDGLIVRGRTKVTASVLQAASNRCGSLGHGLCRFRQWRR